MGVALGLIHAMRVRGAADSAAPALSMDAERPLLTSADARPGVRVDGGGAQAIRDAVDAGRYEH